MDAAKLFEGIALLIDLAQKGEIDPWDVQVIDVIDRYLSKLVFTEATPAAYEADLSQSGQAFLSASMLVLFKANTLIALEQADELDSLPDELQPELEDEIEVRQRLPLEQQLRRRTAALPPRKRRVTLQELIEQLQLMATQLQEQEAIATTTNHYRRLRSQPSAKAFRAALELAHQENLTEVARELEQFLNSHSQPMLTSQHPWLNLDQLVDLWNRETRSTPTVDSMQPHDNDHVSVFWALLLLSAQSKVELSQEEFYQEIKIRSLLDLSNSDRCG